MTKTIHILYIVLPEYLNNIIIKMIKKVGGNKINAIGQLYLTINIDIYYSEGNIVYSELPHKILLWFTFR